MKKRLSLIIAPIITISILLISYRHYGLYPFGENSLAWCDMTQQSIPFMMQTGNQLKEGLGLGYNLKTSGGMNFWGVMLFFAASPLTLLSAIINPKNFLLWANILVLLKAMLASFTASIWFEKILQKNYPFVSATLATSYALCGYTMMYYQNNVWLDVLYIFPLFALSLVDLVKTKRFFWYTITLTMLIIVNYYISYTVIIFTILAIGCVLIYNRNDKKIVLSLAIGTFIALSITAFVWIPSFFQYLMSARTADDSIGSEKFFPNLYTTISFLFCSSLGIIGVVIAQKKTKYEKILTILFTLMMIPIFVNPINKIWHTGSYQAFPVRYGFILVLLGLTLAALGLRKALNDSNKVRLKPYMLVIPVSIVVSVAWFLNKLVDEKLTKMNSYVKSLWVNSESYNYLFSAFVVISGAMVIMFIVLKSKNINPALFSITLVFLIIVEGLFSSAVYIGAVSSSADYFPWIIDLGDKIVDDDFYRVKTDKKIFDINLIGAIGYNNMSHYTSLTREDYLFGMKKLGYSAYWMEVGSHGGTIITDAILNNHYVISKSKYQPHTKKAVYTNSGYWIHENDYQLPFGLVIDGKIEDFHVADSDQRAEMSQKLISAISNTDTKVITNYVDVVFDNVEYKVDDNNHNIKILDASKPASITYTVDVKQPTAFYFDNFHSYSNSLKEKINDSISIKINDKNFLSTYPTQSNNGLQFLGTYGKGTATFTIAVKKSFTAHSFGLWGFDINKIDDLLEKIDTNLTDINTIGNKIKGTVISKGSDFLFLPIAYDEGLKVKVNGNNVEINKVFDCFVGIPLIKGENTISVTHVPKGIVVALLISGLGMFLLFIDERHLLRFAKRFEKPVYVLFIVVCLTTVLLVYLLPVIDFIISK